MMPKFCRNCGHQLKEGSVFCPACGQQLVESVQLPKSCPKCDSKLEEGAKFCPACGAAVTATISPPSRKGVVAKLRGAKWVLLSCLAVLIVAALVLFLVPVTQTHHTSVPVSYSVTDSHGGNNYTLFDVTAHAYVTLRNNDSVAGYFTVSFNFTVEGVGHLATDRYYIELGQSHEFHGSYDISLGDNWTWNYVVTPPTKTVATSERVKLYEKLF